MATETLEQWAAGFIDYLALFGGTKAMGPNDPRVKFLMAMAEHEGTFSTTNPNNPLDIVMNEGVPSRNLSGNTAGVKTFASVEDGYKALHLFLVNQGISGLSQQLMSPHATAESLGQALAAANWEGGSTPQSRAASQQYAATITQMAGGQLPNETTNVANPTGGATMTPLGSGGNTAPPPAYETQGMLTPYTGPGAYKGFDLQAIKDPTELAQTKRAIDAFTSQPGLEQSILRKIFTEFPQDAWMATIPEVRTILLSAVYNNWHDNQIKGAVAGTSWYKQTAPSIRYWQSVSATDPAEAQNAVKQAAAQVTNAANSLGVQLNASQVQQIAQTVASQSFDSQGNYVNGLMPEQSILAMIESTIGQAPGSPVEGAYVPPGMPASGGGGGFYVSPGGAQAAQNALASDQAALSHANATLAAATAAYRKHKDPATEAAVKAAQQGVLAAHTKVQQAQALVAQVGSAQPSPAGAGSASPGAPGATQSGPGGAVTGTGGGDAQILYDAFATIARNYYLNLTPQQIQAKVDEVLKSDTGQGNFIDGAKAGFTQFAQTMAKAQYPALAAILGTTTSVGTDNTPYSALAGYRSLIATYTGYQGDPDTIDLTNPQWSWILSGKQPPSSTGAVANATGQGSPRDTSTTPVLPTYDQVQSYLMGTPQFQSTDMAKQLGWHVASAITRSFGF